MKGFVLCMGRSGSMWTATALRRAAAVDAHHESILPEETLDSLPGGVEVNSHLRRRREEIEDRFPGAAVIHLVRDGRDVVRSIKTRHADTPFVKCCKIWAEENERLLGLPVYRLENLTDDFGCFRYLSWEFGGKADREAWRVLKDCEINRSPIHEFPHWKDWSGKRTAEFWEHAGDMMRVMGYDR